MPTNILLKRGLSTNFNSLVLKSGEPAFVTDTKKLYVGDGTNKVLLNPIDKPAGINIINFYPKIKVNDYGQVIAQDVLTQNDIPILPITKISGLGTVATLNTGNSAGNVPVLDGSAKLNTSVIPISKPASIDIVNFYPKVKVNDYGQVVSQSSLLASDIPNLPNTKITGLGTASTFNTGIAAGNIPILDSSGKLSPSVIPTVTGSAIYAMAVFNGNDSIPINAGKYVPLNSFTTSNSNQFSIDSNGVITVNLTGTYLISYTISSPISAITTALGNGGLITYEGSFSRSSATAVPSYVNTGATIIRNITSVPEKYGIRNNGTTSFPTSSGYGTLTILKIG